MIPNNPEQPNLKFTPAPPPQGTPAMASENTEPIGGEDDSKITSGHGGGYFGGTDLTGPSWDYPGKRAAFLKAATITHEVAKELVDIVYGGVMGTALVSQINFWGTKLRDWALPPMKYKDIAREVRGMASRLPEEQAEELNMIVRRKMNEFYDAAVKERGERALETFNKKRQGSENVKRAGPPVSHTLQSVQEQGFSEMNIPPTKEMPGLGFVTKNKVHGAVRLDDGLWHYFRHTDPEKARARDAEYSKGMLPSKESRLTIDEVKQAGREFHKMIRTAAIKIAQNKDAQIVCLGGRDYVLRGTDAEDFRRKYAATPNKVNTLVEKYMWKLQPHTASYTMRCPWCSGTAQKTSLDGAYKCSQCSWEQKAASRKTADDKPDYGGYDNWITYHTALLIDNTESTLTSKARLAENAMKKGIGVDQLAGQFSRLFKQQYEESKKYYEDNAANARDERGAYEQQQLGGGVPETGDQVHDLGNKLHGLFFDMGGTSSWEEPIGECDWRAIAWRAMEETEESAYSKLKAKEPAAEAKEFNPTTQEDKDFMRDMKIQGALSVGDEHQLRIAIKTLKMPDAMVGVMGGLNKEQALEVLARHGLRWDDADYMNGGKGVKKAGITPGAPWEVVQTSDGNFCFVDHEKKLATTGFGSEEGLLKNADIIRIDEGTLKLMRERYAKEFPQENKVGGKSVKTKQADQKTCIRDGCGMPFDSSEPEKRDASTLRSFWQRYCPKHRTGGNAGSPVIEEKKAAEERPQGVAVNQAELEKEAGFNFFIPGQVLNEFYPEIQHEIVDYPNATNTPSGVEAPEMVGDGGAQRSLDEMLDGALDNMTIVEAIDLPGDVGEIEEIHLSARTAADYVSTSPAGGMGIGRDGKPEVLEGAPLRKENDIRGPMFTDEYYGQYTGVPGNSLQMAAKKANDDNLRGIGDVWREEFYQQYNNGPSADSILKTAAESDAEQFAMFLKKVCGEIAATMVTAFKVTSRPLLDKVPGMGEVQLAQIEQPQSMSVFNTVNTGSRVAYLMEKLNDGEIKDAVNDAWAQAAVWHDGPKGGFVYEVFVRMESIDTDSMIAKYKFVAGTRE